MANADKWTVKIETSIETRWVDADWGNIIDKGSEPNRTETLTVDADTKAEAMRKAKSLCYDVCDTNWVGVATTQENGHTYRVEQRRFKTNYWVE